MQALVEGRVQGVGFRCSTVRAAQALHLTGWVRNLDSGDVEVWAEGDREAVDALLIWLERGPPGAFVSAVRASKRDIAGYADFDVEY